MDCEMAALAADRIRVERVIALPTGLTMVFGATASAGSLDWRLDRRGAVPDRPVPFTLPAETLRFPG